MISPLLQSLAKAYVHVLHAQIIIQPSKIAFSSNFNKLTENSMSVYFVKNK